VLAVISLWGRLALLLVFEFQVWGSTMRVCSRLDLRAAPSPANKVLIPEQEVVSLQRATRGLLTRGTGQNSSYISMNVCILIFFDICSAYGGRHVKSARQLFGSRMDLRIVERGNFSARGYAVCAVGRTEGAWLGVVINYVKGLCCQSVFRLKEKPKPRVGNLLVISKFNGRWNGQQRYPTKQTSTALRR
jgi:hypothetical protein